jgi:hypothetical protein
MMSIVKEKHIVWMAAPVRADLRHQAVAVPFVDEHKISIVQGPVEIEIPFPVERAAEAREQPSELAQWFDALLDGEVLQTPAVRRLVDTDGMPPRLQLGDNAAQEMRIAVVPVGQE